MICCDLDLVSTMSVLTGFMSDTTLTSNLWEMNIWSLCDEGIGYSIAPANADANTKKYADYITSRSGGDRACVTCLHLMDKFCIL